MATDKAPTGARTVESDPNFMLLFFYIRYTKEGVTDWDKLTQLMSLPTVGATYVILRLDEYVLTSCKVRSDSPVSTKPKRRP